MAKPEPIDPGSNGRHARRDERGRFKEAEDVGPSPGTDRRQTTKAPETYGVHAPAELAALPQEGVAELVAATREQTAAIERQTAVFERLLTFLSPLLRPTINRKPGEILLRPRRPSCRTGDGANARSRLDCDCGEYRTTATGRRYSMGRRSPPERISTRDEPPPSLA